MRCFVMFVTAVCILFLLKLKWPKNKSLYNMGPFSQIIPKVVNDMGKLFQVIPNIVNYLRPFSRVIPNVVNDIGTFSQVIRFYFHS